MHVNRKQVIGATVGMVALAAFVPTAYASPPSGLTPTTQATASFASSLDLENRGVHLETEGATDVRSQKIVFAPNSSSGWHHHPGMVMVVVATGSVTVWDQHCKATTYGPLSANGAAFFEAGDDANLVTSTEGATNYVTYIVPKVTPAVFRIEDVAPSCAS